MREWEALFRLKKPDPARLLAFGFRESGNQFLWETPINEGQFHFWRISMIRDSLTIH